MHQNFLKTQHPKTTISYLRQNSIQIGKSFSKLTKPMHIFILVIVKFIFILYPKI